MRPVDTFGHWVPGNHSPLVGRGVRFFFFVGFIEEIWIAGHAGYEALVTVEARIIIGADYERRFFGFWGVGFRGFLGDVGGFYHVVVFAFGFGPGGGAKGTVFDGFGVDDHVGGFRGEGGVLDVGGGDAKGAEEEREDAVFDVSHNRQAHDFGEGELDGVGIFESGEYAIAEGAVGAAVHGIYAFPAVVEVATAMVAQGGGSALDAVDFYVLATEGWFGGHNDAP